MSKKTKIAVCCTVIAVIFTAALIFGLIKLNNRGFKSYNKLKKVNIENITELGTVTQIYLMNDFLFVEITDKNAVRSDEIKEDGYFSICDKNAVFAVDLNTKNVYSLDNIFSDMDLLLKDNTQPISFSVEHGLLFTNPGLVNSNDKDYYIHRTYFLTVRENNLELIKISDTVAGNYLQDIHGNVYLIEDEPDRYPVDENLYTFEHIKLLKAPVNGRVYSYFLSTDRQVYRALNDSLTENGKTQRYNTAESLQADGSWSAETSSSDKILRSHLAYSEDFYGGEWMLKDGKIVRIATRYANPAGDCYNVDGKLIAHTADERQETILSLGDANQVTADFEYFNFNNGFDSYDIIANYEYDENRTQKDLKYYIEITRLGYVLTSYDRDTDNHKKYKIETDNSRILLTEITPPNNGAELFNAIIFKN